MAFIYVDKVRELLDNCGLSDRELRNYKIEVIEIPWDFGLEKINTPDAGPDTYKRRCEAWDSYLDKENKKLIIRCYVPGSWVCYTGYTDKDFKNE